MTNFSDMTKPELQKVIDKFGVDVAANAKKDEILAALDEWGITEEAYEPEPETVEAPVEDGPVEIVTAQTELPATSQKFLIKMVRENNYFEWKNFKFTQERPFALMSSSEAQEILTVESGFRQALPSELEEFYN